MRKPVLIKFISVVFALSVLAGCGGGAASPSFTGTGSGTTPTPTPTPTPTGPAVASVKLISNATQLPSSASTSSSTGAVTLTVIVKDAGNNLLSGVPVTITTARKTGTSCGGGGAVTPPGSTGTDGTVKSTLTTSGDQTNQIITVTATAGGISDTLDMPVTGTSLKLTGPATVGAGATGTFTVKLVDSANVGIGNQNVSLAGTIAGNAITPATQNTQGDGTATFTYTGTNGGSETLTASAGCAVPGTLPVQVTSKILSYTAPASGTLIPVGAATGTAVTINFKQGSGPIAGAVMSFTTTRGNFASTSALPACPPAPASCANSNLSINATTDGSGNATVFLSQPSVAGAVGAATLTVSNGTGANLVSTTLPVEFVSTTPASIKAQAQPPTVPTNGTSSITAVVRDANDNPVKNQLVDFSLTGTGSLAVPSNVTTDGQGVATLNYTAPSSSTAKDGVTVTATLDGTATKSPVSLTVASQPLNIVLGTSNVIAESADKTQDMLPYTAIVTDAAGNPQSGATVTFTLVSLSYAKGSYAADNQTQVVNAAACNSEDVNINGILDAGEDTNGNGVLDPGGVASVPGSKVTDSSGSVSVNIIYPKDRATWVRVKLTASVTVTGTEGVKSASFVLPGLAADYGSTTVAPPGKISPYGQAGVCSNPN